MNVLRPAIIWCDSRAVAVGNAALEAMGPEAVSYTHLDVYKRQLS